MCRFGLVSMFVLFFASHAPGDFTYSDFSSTAGLNILGDTLQVGNEIHLTQSVGNQLGGLYRVDQEMIAAGFDIHFDFQITTPAGGAGADGFAFIIQNESDSALQTKLWNVLNEGQQALVEVEINTWRDQMAQERMDQVTQRYLDQRRDAARAAPPQRDRLAHIGPRDGFNPRLRESIAKLKPEARRRLIERLRKRWNERQKEVGSDRDKASKPTDAPRRRPGG